MDPAVVVLLVESDLNASWREQEHMLPEPMFLTVDGPHATGHEISGTLCMGDLHGREVKHHRSLTANSQNSCHPLRHVLRTDHKQFP